MIFSVFISLFGSCNVLFHIFALSIQHLACTFILSLPCPSSTRVLVDSEHPSSSANWGVRFIKSQSISADIIIKKELN